MMKAEFNGKILTGELAKRFLAVGLAKKPIQLAKKRTESEKPTDETVKLPAKETIELIVSCTSLEQLETYKDDSRKTVVNAYNKKLKEM